MTKLRQGNVFAPVCDSAHRGVSVPACTTGHMTGGSLSGGSLSEGGSLSGGLFRGGLCQGDPQTETPLYSNERAVRILLECILVLNVTDFDGCMTV